MIEENDTKVISVLKNSGFILDKDVSDYSNIQTRSNYILSLDGKTEEEVFNNFHSKWRYNIRLAARKGVTCNVCGIEDLDDFYKLMKITGLRDGFKVRKKEYYENIMNTMGDNSRLYICSYNGIPVSGALAVRYSGKIHYVYGASSNEYRNVMPSYLMQWEIIKWALQSKSQYYDFMGIPYYNDESHPNYGVYRFKKGFGGAVVCYAGEFDYLSSPVTGRFLRKYLTRIRSR